MKIKEARPTAGATIMKKRPTLYIIILSAWLCCTALLIYSLVRIATGLTAYGPVRTAFIIALLSVNTAVLAILWLGSIKDFIFSAAYVILRKKLDRQYKQIDEFSYIPDPAPRFLLLYCTCNDFNAKALSECRKQNYPNFKTVILDDSSDPQYKKEIDRYRFHHRNVEVVRRTDRTGYKAGNLKKVSRLLLLCRCFSRFRFYKSM